MFKRLKRKKDMKTTLGERNDAFAIYAAIIAAGALICLALLASEKAAALPLPHLELQKMAPIVVVATRLP